VKIRTSLVLLFGLTLAVGLDAQSKKKKKEDEVTQTLPVLKDPPAAVAAETGKLVFHLSPLSAKGLLSQQVRDALKNLFQENHGAAIVKLRAFVAGSGDLRRVQQLVSEIFTDRKMALPTLTTIQVGAFPVEGAQVVIESIAMEKRTVNPNGLAFFSGQQTNDVRLSIAQLQTAVKSAGVEPAGVLRTTCFLSSLDDAATARGTAAAAFPSAAADFMQLQRDAVEPLAECEAVGRLTSAPASAVVLVNPPSLTANPNYSQIALVNAPKIVLTGTQMAFGEQESDVRLAFERLGKALDPMGVSYKDVFWSGTYPLTSAARDQVRAVRFNFLDKSRPPASTLVLFEGLPSLDARVAIEVIAAVK
jgi:enamine deaminase RidA (YjgF/YER057c/UK114 family)